MLNEVAVAKVGHCQAIYTKNPVTNVAGFFIAWNLCVYVAEQRTTVKKKPSKEGLKFYIARRPAMRLVSF